MKSDPGSSQSLSEVREIHSRLIKCPLAVEESRAYWARANPDDDRPDAQIAFENYWFGAKSLPWVKVLVLNMQSRFDAFPEAFAVLRRWHSMAPETRTAICHWHLQLTDPLYRAFSGDFLVNRHGALRPEIHRNTVITWVSDQCPGRWTIPSRQKLASRLLSSAHSAGLVSGRRDPRQLVFPRVRDDALAYLLHLLRGISFEGSLNRNPYLRSVGIEGSILESRFAALPSLQYRRIGDVIEFGWRHQSLTAWAKSDLFADEVAA
jgi:hypothetical protein